ncbi:MAG TPA: hypothetical protein VGB77_12340 [Abditibacteriaceae bacterium]|jgi:hypothetical protein
MHINGHLKSYKKVKTVDESEHYVDLTAYFERGQLRKLVTGEGDDFSHIEEYYYWYGRLIFIFEEYIYPDFDSQGKQKQSLRTQNRYYFHKGKMIRWINEKGHVISPGTQEFKKEETFRIWSSREAIASLRKKHRH